MKDRKFSVQSSLFRSLWIVASASASASTSSAEIQGFQIQIDARLWEVEAVRMHGWHMGWATEAQTRMSNMARVM
jgi:hypothetical protein